MVDQINDTTYRITLPGGDDIEIGDITAGIFRPHIKAKRWGGEAFLTSILAGDLEEETEVEIDGDKVKYKYKVKNGFEIEIESEFYATPATGQFDLGAFEHEIVLASKPPTNQIVFDIDFQNLRFHYQRPLTDVYAVGWSDEFQATITSVTETEVVTDDPAKGTSRPENIVGSYAVYHATKKNHRQGKTNYMAGKAFHIPRPKIYDALNNWVWGELFIDPVAKTYTVTIPQAFLDTATYPIRHAAGDTFGYTTAGGSIFWTTNEIHSNQHLGVLGNAQTMHCYNGERPGWGSGAYRMGLWEVPTFGVLVGTTADNMSGIAMSWKHIALVEAPLAVTAILYYPGYWFGVATHALGYDDNTVQRYRDAEIFGNPFPNPATFIPIAVDYEWSIYVTVDAGGGGGAEGMTAAMGAKMIGHKMI